MEAELAELKAEVKRLHAKLQKVEDEAEIRKVHFKYGYYIDKCLYNEVVDMFSNHPDAYVEFLGSRYRRKEGIRRLYIGRFQTHFVKGRNGPVYGFLLDHPMMQEIVDVDATGTRAWARIRALMSAGTHQSIQEEHPRGHAQWWEGGVYENEYIKEDGVWKPFRYRYFPFWHADFERGWAHTKKNYIPWPTKTYPEDPLGPDELLEQKMLWPDTRVVPFHYPHPVTGRMVKDDDLRAPKYGEDVSTSLPPLSIALPKDQQEKEAEEAKKVVAETGEIADTTPA
ncbi:hypothetical protein AYO20_02614 [Fonsecaea nubica]|uniref:SnoaL-like domain-containing protein n=1 Tax=Fonsecaea nubica TaxID=856822 RepID=A0A178D987_9EURO|nr:hypothetical protein AYO20_02614 [Fonsecaea nubica]OAL38162.1 hypothetical protein AYO20_02614 [Fonsecaea nubica]